MTIKYQLRDFWIGSFNRLQFGGRGPRYAERIWVSPAQCKRYIEAAELADRFGTSARQLSGRVVSDWPESLEQSLEKHPKLAYCWSHWRDGKSWADSGAFDFMLERIAASPTGVTDKCRNLQDVERRFEALDAIWADVRKRGSLPPRGELVAGNFREVGGILMHLGPGGEPIFSGAGCHRFAMALMLDAPFPAQLGVVHKTALDTLQRLRLPE